MALKPFNILYEPSLYEQLIVDAYEEVNPDVMKLLQEGYEHDIVGNAKEARKNFVKVNYRYYIILLSILMKRYSDRENLSGNCNVELRNKYKIDCILKNMQCEGFNIKPILDIFGLTESYATNTGINSVTIETGCNPLIVQ